LGILLALIFLSFFGTLTLSASMLPESYDWRYQVISNLLSPRDNPGHYWLAAAGLGLSAVLMLPLVEYLRRYLKTIAPRTAKVSAGAFILGIIALICACFVVPQHADAMFGIEQLHEFLGRSAATLLVTGMLCACWCAWKGRAQLSFALSWVWSVVTVLPLTGLFVSNALCADARASWAAPTPPCVTPFLASRLFGSDRRGRAFCLFARQSSYSSATPRDSASRNEADWRRRDFKFARLAAR
jgi:hypothetical protein